MPYRSDAVDIVLDGESYTFSNQDPFFHYYREEAQKDKYEDIIAKSTRTETGYLLEVAFPLKKIGLSSKSEIPINIEIGVKDML